MLLLNENIYYGSSSMFTLFVSLIINLFKTLSLMFLNTLKDHILKLLTFLFYLRSVYDDKNFCFFNENIFSQSII